ncbi:hypothetical protein LWI29_018465 [Acer saccharum]|uniref:BED-type domain-containing protein n=1 Tax=Acer saccharum TaxID=4024 RepID=A0AA39SLC1_ACESA|nr:hypothetical protein LWI29_018465 [Acer saccharum]
MSSEGQTWNSDVAWRYFTLPDPKDRNAPKCKFCGKVLKGGIFRGKQHLVGGFKNVTDCRKCPEAVKQEIQDYMLKKKRKEDRILPPGDYDSGFGEGDDDDDDDDDDVLGTPGSFSRNEQ